MISLARILFFTDDPEGGGVAQYNHAVLCALAARGYRVTCVQTRADNPLIRRQAEAGVLHDWLNFDTGSDFRRTLVNAEDADHFLHDHAPDLVVFSNGCPFSHFAAKQAAIRRQVPYVVVEGFVATYLANKFHELLEELGRHYAQAQAVIAVSHENLQLLHRCFRLPRGMGRVIYYGRPASYFQAPDPSTRNRLRTAWGIPADAVLGFTAARLDPIKGYQYQVAAIERLQRTVLWPRLYFAWAGTGVAEAQIREDVRLRGASDHVRFLGRRWDVPDCLAAADIYLHPSEAEGMPLAVMEAMARGLPVIASAVSGIPEELGPTGKLLPAPAGNAPAAVAALATTVEQWAGDDALRQAVGSACRARAEELFREERMVAQTLEVINRALLPVGDYVSPGLAVIRPDRHFPHMRIGDRGLSPWPYLRHYIPHNWYVDERFPLIGWLDRDETHILYHSALQFRGRRALEIGCLSDWSACHLALAGVELDVIHPLLAQSIFQDLIRTVLQAVAVPDSVSLHAGESPAKVQELGTLARRRWSLFFIDGEQEGPAPLRDAQVCAQFAADDAMIILHDLASPHVAQGLDYLREQGWQTLVYQTMQIMGVAWRGNVRPIQHQPDPRIAWDLPQHLLRYRHPDVP